MILLKKIWVLVGLIFVVGLGFFAFVHLHISHATGNPTLALNDSLIVQSSTQRVGMNIGAIDYYDSGIVLKNLVGALDPGFEPLKSKQIWALTTGGTPTSFTNTSLYDSVQQNYLAGATFSIVASQTNNGQQGCTGTILSNTGQSTIASISRSNNVVTVTTNIPSGYSVGNQIVVENVADGSFNGYPVGTITSISGNTITYSQTGANATSSGGVVQQLADPVYTTTACNGPFSIGDIIIVQENQTSTPESWFENSQGGFWAGIGGGGKLLPDNTDLCPTCGSQSLDMDANATGSTAGGNWYFGTTNGVADNFVLLNGTYKIDFWAKAASGSPTLSISANRPVTGGFSCGPYTVTPTNSWAYYQVTCTAAETPSTTGLEGVQLGITATGGSVYFDNVDFEKTNGDPTNTTVFRDEVINTLKTLNPGLLRDWLGQNGEDLDNWTAPDYAEDPSTAGYFIGPGGSGQLNLPLEDYLNVVKTIGAVPYFEVPVTFSTTDAANLIEFLGGSTNTTYGARRAALGQTAPWTSVFPVIHLSYCNECWNTFAQAENLDNRSNAPVTTCLFGPCGYYDYQTRAQAIFAAMRANPSYVSSSFDLVMDLQTPGYLGGPTAIAYAKPDSVEIEEYTYANVNNDSSDANLWQPEYVEPYDNVVDPNSPDGFYQSLNGVGQASLGGNYLGLHTCGASGTAQCKVNIYEWADGTTAGSIDQTHLDYINAGAGQGIVAALQPLLNLQYYDIQVQNYFALTEIANSGPNGETSKLWGSTVDMGGSTNEVRPQFLGLELVNKSIIGPMYSCPISNNATYNFAGNSQNGASVPPGMPALNNVPYLYSFCFENGTNRSLVVVNTNLTTSYPLSFSGTNVPSGTVTQRQYAPSSPDLLNETPTGASTFLTQPNVVLTQSSLSNPSSVTIPADSVTAFDYTASASTSTPDTTPPSVPTGLTVTQTTTSTVILSWTASTDNVGVVGYKIYRGGTQVGTSTTAGFLNTGLSASTTYSYTVSAYDAAGNVSAQSGGVSATTGSLPDTTPPSVPTGLTATAVSPSQINLSWTASTDNVGVTGYKIYKGGVLLATSTLTTYSSTGLSPATTYSYTVSAYDAAGNVSAQSGSVSATTGSPSDTTPPTTSITSPTNNATVSSTITVSASASDNVGVTSVALYVDGVLMTTDTVSPYTFSLNTTSLTNGTHTLETKAYDAAGNVGTSPSITVTVTNAPQTLTATLTASNTSSTAPLTTSLTATAAGTASGTINYIFYCNRADASTSLIGTPDLTISGSLVNPYTATNVCTYPSAGTYTSKVIVERGTALPAQAQKVITVSSAPITSSTPSSTFAITGVVVTSITDTSAQITITTNALASVNVRYGLTTAYGNTTAASPELTTIYENLVGLSQNTPYDFVVNATAQGATSTVSSTNMTFTTAVTPAPVVASTGGGGGGGGGGGYVPPAKTPTSTATSTLPGSSSSSGGTSSSTPITGGSAPVIYFPRPLSYGDTGADVMALQVLLQKIGFFAAGTVPTSYFGTKTQHAVSLFQGAHLLTITGSVDVATEALLNKVANNQYEISPSLPSSTPPTPTSTPIVTSPSGSGYVFTRYLTLGSKGSDVTALQQLLITLGDYPTAIVSGYYGMLTEKAVELFQSQQGIINYGLPYTTGYGAVGPRTRAALNAE